MSELLLRSLVKTFLSPDKQVQRVVDGIDLAIPAGRFYSLLGPSGCGKTTTLRMIAGFEEPDAGDVLLDGLSLLGKPPYQRPVTTVFQSYALFPHLTVAQNVAFGLHRRGDKDVDGPVREALELVRMQPKADRMPQKLSGGEKQRVALARAIVLRPKLLLLDEPLSALDPKLRGEMRAELRELQRELGITFLFITHDQQEALALSDSIALMHQGKIAQLGSPEEIYLRPANRFVAGFLGAVNWHGAVGIRPERTRLSRTAVGGEQRAMPATVRLASFAGDCLQVEVRTESGESLLAQVPHEEGQFHPGERIFVHWHPRDEIPLPQ